MAMRYENTLILPPDDCLVGKAIVPKPVDGKMTEALIQYEWLSRYPGKLTQEDILLLTHLVLNDSMPRSKDGYNALRIDFFKKARACLRSSPLVQQYAWNIYFDRRGFASLVSESSIKYKRYMASGGVRKLKAFSGSS